MISPAKMVMAAAIAALAGTLLLAGQDATQPPGPSVTDSQGPAGIYSTHGEMRASQVEQGDSTATEEGVTTIDERWSLEFRMDDPRLDVTGEGSLNEYSFGSGGPKTWSGRFANEDGSWWAQARAYTAQGSGGWHHQILLTGEGGYEGLSAILSVDQDISGSHEVDGVIFSGELPPLPEPAPTSTE